MENWISGYRLPAQLNSLGVDRGGEAGLDEGGVSPVPGTTPSPTLINMWPGSIKVEASAGNNVHQQLNQSGSIKGRRRFLCLKL